ncbi:DUF4167 domain-containing protein [Pelagibius sp. Alg239-R121]|uniref:DUF4167 domain-containing protein n=1 Tax=Pelagibius sp. Alg239-R121 TaxID=2993448 RepID=UPI0024A71CB9|nr:DUF4167 domain-containing protein [Pelagibius sp. Alg239-R121]
MRQQNSNGGRRPRGRTNNRKQHSGGQHRSGTYDSNGPDGRIRGNASQVYEKYVGLARDATSSGDRIAAEAYYQHAEHYYRIVNDSTDPESAGSHRAHTAPSQNGTGAQMAQGNAAPQANGEIEVNQSPQGTQSGRGNQGRSDQGRSDQSRSEQGRSERSGYQDRRGGRGPARNDTEVPGLEPQPEVTPGNAPAFSERNSQNELPLSGDEGQRRAPRGGRLGERGRGRPRATESQPAPAARAESKRPPDPATPSLEESIPAAIKPVAAATEASTKATADDVPAAEAAPAPKRRGRPRKRPLEETQETAATGAPVVEAAPAVDTAEPAPAPKRRGRPRKVVVEAAPAAEKDEGSDEPNAANA